MLGVVLLATAAVHAAAPASADWPAYLGGEDRSHYSTLAQINPANVHTLAVVWTYRAGEVGANPRSEMQCNRKCLIWTW